MTDLVGIPVEHRQDGSNGAGHGIGEHSTQGKQKHRDPGDLNDTDQNAAPNQRPVGERESGGDAVLGEQLVDGPRKVPQSTQEDHRATFYEHYRKEAEEYDKDFMKKHDEDLNTTLIFAGLFSAVASAFIVQVQPQLQPDPNEETAALLRVLIHKVDNTTFGGDVPDLPQWTGPPRTIIQVQTVLYASLFASLLSAFLAMLGKQWLNRYASTDMRGSAIERSQNRQRKLDGIVVWYFDHVMESLPVMLQIALLLLGCALSRYLWEIDTTVASVVIGVTSFGVLFYLFIVFAGAASDACPYQTPGANVIRSFLGLLRSPHVPHVESSMLYYAFVNYWRHTYWSSPSDVIKRILAYPFILPMLFIFDALHLGKATLRTLVVSARRAHSWLFGASLVQDQATKLNFHCIVWMLQTSLDKTTNVSTLKFLETILALSGLGSSTISAVVMGCFNVFSSSFITDGGMRVTVAHGSEQLAGMSAMCFLRALSCLLSAEPTSTVIQDVCQRYDRIFPPYPNFKDIPFCFTMDAIHSLVTRRGATDWHNWRDYDPSPDELIPFSRALAQAAKFEYHRGRARTSVWLSHFAFHFLSQDQLPPTLVVLDCLTIIAINFGCNVPHANGMAPDECVRLEQLFALIVQKYDTIGPDDLRTGRSEDSAMIAFLPYAARREEGGVALPISLKYATLEVVRYERYFLKGVSNIGTVMRLWMAAASAVPYTDGVGRSVVDTLFSMASDEELSPHIPVSAWGWLKKRPVLITDCWEPKWGAYSNVTQMVRRFQDVQLITSYLFVVWSEWIDLDYNNSSTMMAVIREELCGIEAVGYRADLIQRLGYVLSQLHPRSDRGEQYGEFRTALVEMDEEATKTLAGCHSTFMCALPLPCP